MNPDTQNFCRNVLFLRLLHKLTRKQMAQIMEISIGKLGRIERQELPFRISVGMLCRLCEYFGLSADVVLKEDLFQKSLRRHL